MKITVTKEQIQPLIHNDDINVDDETKDIITDAIVEYINDFFQTYKPSEFYEFNLLGLEEWPVTTTWEAAFPCGSNRLDDTEMFVITKRNTAVVLERKNHKINVTSYTGYVIER